MFWEQWETGFLDEDSQRGSRMLPVQQLAVGARFGVGRVNHVLLFRRGGAE